MPTLTFVDPNGKHLDVEAEAGKSLLDIAQEAGLEMEGACEGSIACSTCHVIVEADWFGRLATASEEEEDMLDLCAHLTATSRLSCQITFTDELDGLTVRLPDEWVNLLG